MHHRKKHPIPRNVFALGLTSLFNDFSSEMILSVMPAFFSSVLGVGAAALGIVEGVADAVANIMKIASGTLSDKFGQRKALTASGYTLSLCVRPLYVLATSVGGVALLRFADRVGKGVREPPRDAIVSLSVRKEDAARSFGFHRTMDTTGAILGPIAAFALISLFPGSFSLIFIVSFFVGLGAIAAIWGVRDSKGHAPRPAGAPRGPLPPWHLSKHFRVFLVAVTILSAGSLPLAVLLLSVGSAGFALTAVPLFYAFYNLVYASFATPAGIIADRIGLEKVIVSGYILLVLVYIIFAVASTPPAVAIAFAALGVFSALTAGVQRAYTALHSDERHRGTAFGYFNAAVGLGAMVAGIGGGLLWEMRGPSVALFASAATILAGLLVFTVGNGYLGRTRTPSQSPPVMIIPPTQA